MVWCHFKVAHISPGYGTYLNLVDEVIARAPIVDGNSTPKLNQESLDIIYLDYQFDTFKIDNALVYQNLSMVVMDMDAYVYMKQRESMQDNQSVFFDVHKHFIGPDHVAKQATYL